MPACLDRRLTVRCFRRSSIDRFGLKVRRESRLVRAYTLSIAPRGTTLSRAAGKRLCSSAAAEPPRPAQAGLRPAHACRHEPTVTLVRAAGAQRPDVG
jgi:uncharacterized protein (TIGR03435 family)